MLEKSKNKFINKIISDNKIKQLQNVFSKSSINDLSRSKLYKNFLYNMDSKKLPVKVLSTYKNLKQKLLDSHSNFNLSMLNSYPRKNLINFNFIPLNKHLHSCKISKDKLFLVLNENYSSI